MTDQVQHSGQYPSVPIALSFAIGIALDRVLAVPQPYLWLMLCLLLCPLWCCLRLQLFRASVACVLLLVGVAGGLNHHRSWFDYRSDDIDHLLGEQGDLFFVRGSVVGFVTNVIRTQPDIAIWGKPEKSRFVLDVHEVNDAGRWRRATGALRVEFPEFVVLAPGETVEIKGFVERLAPPRNPGEADFREYLRAQNIRGVLRVKVPSLLVHHVEQRPWLGRLRLWLRQKCDSSLREHLSGDSLGIALAFLLGDRSLLSDSVEKVFIETGTMHVLSISGVHVTILALFVVTAFRLAGLSHQFGAWVVLAVVLAYLGIAEVRPPMVRAFLTVVMGSVSVLKSRTAFSGNLLAVAGIIVLVMNPMDLFDVGTQLSFLSVAVIISWTQYVSRREELEEDDEELPDEFLPLWQRWLRPAGRAMLSAFLLSGLIWLVTAPLTLATFHVISPISPVVNLPIAPIASPALCIGFLFLLVSLLVPWAAAPISLAFDGLLRLMLWCVELGASVPGGHIYAPSPPTWWLLGSYVCFAAFLLADVYRRRRQWLMVATVAWLIFGISVSMKPTTSGELRVSVLSVGRGLCVLIETPSGRAVVYDVGSSGSGESARRALSDALWSRGHSRIAALILSHPDADQFNGAEPMMELFRVERLVMSPQFGRSLEPQSLAVMAKANALKVPIDFVERGNQLEVDPDVSIRVLHPRGAESFVSDNAGSLVVELSFRDRRIVLMGDLEGGGVSAFLRDNPEPGRVDVVVLPRSEFAQKYPSDLIRWASPQWVVASGASTLSGRKLESRFPAGTQILNTSQHGALEFVVMATGDIKRLARRPTAEVEVQ